MTASIIHPPVQDVLQELYEETFPVVAAFVSKMGGSAEDAKDIFHDALIIAFEKNSNNPAYIVGIAKHLWVRKFNRDRHLVDLDSSIEIPEEEVSPVIARLARLLESAGKSCLELLQSFYYEKQTAEEIADKFNYSSAHSATVQKHKCLQKVRSFVKTKSLGYESFVE